LGAWRILFARSQPVQDDADRAPPVAGHAHDLVNGAVYLDHDVGGAARPLVEPIDVLRDNRLQDAAPLELDERPMSGTWDRAPRRVRESSLPGESSDFRVRHVVANVR